MTTKRSIGRHESNGNSDISTDDVVPASPLEVSFFVLSFVSIATLAVALSLGWSLPNEIIWDLRARIYFAIGAVIIALLSIFGLASVVTLKLPQRYRGVPFMAALGLLAMGIVGVQTLSPQSSLEEVLKLAAIAVGGMVAGGAVGLLMGLSSEAPGRGRDGPHRHVYRIMFGIIFLAWVSLIAVIGLRDHAEPAQQHEVARYDQANAHLYLTVVSAPIFGNVGILKISNGDQSNVAALDRDQIGEVQQLVEKAAQDQPNGRTFIGAVSDGEPSDPARIEIWSSSEIEIRLSSKRGSSVVFIMPRRLASDFSKRLQEFGDELE